MTTPNEKQSSTDKVDIRYLLKAALSKHRQSPNSPVSPSSARIQCPSTNEFTVCAFYTVNTPYEEEVKNLKHDCERLGLKFVSQGYGSTGRWVRNAGLKPSFLGTMLRSIPTNILYVDADARIRQYPKLFDDFDGDIGVHYRRGRELLSGTIFLRNNERVRMLVNFWQGEQMLRPETWDQKTLDYVVQARAENLGVKVVDLPPSYTQIFDSMAHHGAPVIEHMQASRRYKKLVTIVDDPTILKFPGVIGKVRIRQAADGTLYITRRDKQAETWLDVNAIRLKGQLRWFPIPPKTLDDLEKLKPEFQDKTICIVGKGPSLDNLRPEHFPKDATIIALNEAIHKVETLSLSHESVFCLQQDARLRDTCLPKQARILASVKAMNFYSQVKDRAFIFDARQWGLNMNALSVSAAIALARRFGARDFILLCFDACVNKKLDYAECVGYDATWGGKKERFLTHRRKIEYRLKSYPTKWVIPEVPVGTSVDRPQQS